MYKVKYELLPNCVQKLFYSMKSVLAQHKAKGQIKKKFVLL